MRKKTSAESSEQPPFNVEAFLESAGADTQVVEYGRSEVIFRQGEPCDRVLYLQKGEVKISVLSKAGRQAVIAMLGPGDFFGEGGLAGQPVRVSTATAGTSATVRVVDQGEMIRLLREQPAMSDRLLAYLLSRVIHVEEELVDLNRTGNLGGRVN